MIIFQRIFKYNIETNKLYLTNKFLYQKCLLCIKNIIFESKFYIFCFGTDGNLLIWKISNENDESSRKDEEIIPEKIESLHQSGINAVDIWQNSDSKGRVLIATVGDDTRLSVIELDMNSDYLSNYLITKKDMSHSSSIVGKKFALNNNGIFIINN
jgi:hypothetical protein